MKKYYSLAVTGKEADIYIFGDILDPTTKDWWGVEADVSGYSLVQDVKDLDVDVINVHINSYGGYVSEGLAIYNTLKNHKATVRTYCDGFACSAASVVFMAGDERIMNSASLLLVHNASSIAAGTAAELRKEADDLETITQASINTYMAAVNITEEELKGMLDKETWLLPQEALEKGFATAIINDAAGSKASQSARKALYGIIINGLERNSVAPASPEPEPPVPQENKTLKFLTALMGGKE